MSNLLINEPPLMVLPSLACAIGLNEAIVLQQIHYWLDPRGNKNIREGRHWVYNSYKQWKEQFPFFSERTIRRTIQSLENSHLLMSKEFNSRVGDMTKWYCINYEKLSTLEVNHKASGQNGHVPLDKVDTPSGQNGHNIYRTEITTDTLCSPCIPQSNTNPVPREEEGLNPIAEEMIKHWDIIVKGKERSTFLKPNRTQKLMTALASYFSNDVSKWNKYCSMIASSNFLMGETKEKFQVKIDWAIKPESIEKILEGSITTGDRETKKLPTSKEESYAKATKKYNLLTPEEINQHKESYLLSMRTKNPAFNEESLNDDQFWIKNFKHYVITEIMKEIEESQLTVKRSFH